jgi:hypothetical protein
VQDFLIDLREERQARPATVRARFGAVDGQELDRGELAR